MEKDKKEDKKITFRSDVAMGLEHGAESIDREAGVIHGYSVISKGEAKGHDLLVDDTSLDQAVKLGNESGIGLKSRFGHPGMSSNALGTFLGRAKNFRRDGDVTRADLYIDKTAYETPNGNLADYVFDLAESDPDAFGTSLVFSGFSEPQVDKNGEKIRGAKPFVRFKKLYASDLVDDPAANNGMFGGMDFFTPDVELSARATIFLDKLLTDQKALSTVIGFLSQYAVNASEGKTNSQQEIKEEENGMEFSELNLKMLKKERPDLVAALSGQEKVEVPGTVLSVLDEGQLESAVSDERNRCMDIMKEAGQFAAQGTDVSELADKHIKNGEPVEKALSAFKDARITHLEKSSVSSPGPGIEEVDESSLSFEEKVDREWNASAKLKEEFSSKESYVAFKKAVARGAVRAKKTA